MKRPFCIGPAVQRPAIDVRLPQLASSLRFLPYSDTDQLSPGENQLMLASMRSWSSKTSVFESLYGFYSRKL